MKGRLNLENEKGECQQRRFNIELKLISKGMKHYLIDEIN